MSESQTIPWKRLAIEASAIVGSILLAFAIDAWWDESQNRKHLQSVMVGLETAFSENVRLIDENIELADS